MSIGLTRSLSSLGLVTATALMLGAGPAASAAGGAHAELVVASTSLVRVTPSPIPAPTDPSSPGPGTASTAPSEPDPSPAPVPTPTATQAPTKAPSPGPTEPGGDDGVPEPGTPTPTSDPTPSEPSTPPATKAPVDPVPEEQPAPAPQTTDDPVTPHVTVFDPIPPASATTSGSWASWIIALVVLASSGLLLLFLRRRTHPRAQVSAGPDMPRPGPVPGSPASRSSPATTSSAARVPSAVLTFSAIEAVGEAMLDATYSVITIETTLEDIARANSFPETEVVVMPTALFVSTRGGGELYTGAISSGRHKLLLHQVDALDQLVHAARSGEIDPIQILAGIHDVRTAPPPFSGPVRAAAYVLICVGIAIILGASWVGIAVASVLGGCVGAARLLTAGVARQREPLVTVALAFGVSTTVFLLTRAGWDPGILPSLIAPLVIFLPGALLTIGIIELAAGQMMSGAGRLMAGFMQLVLLAVGIVAGAALVGVPQLVLSGAYHPIGPVGPWIAVAIFGVGVVIHQGGRRESIPWILLVLYVAYGAQVIGDVFFGGILSALIGAFAMTPVAVLVARHPSGPAASVSFLPAFWLLVPGALGLVGVASLLGGDGDGMSTLVTTISTMVAIALGILAGSAFTRSWGSLRGDVL